MIVSLDEILAIVNTSKKVAIYGAGMYAKVLYTFLETRSLQDKIEIFLVSSEGERKTYQDKEICVFSQMQEGLADYAIIIAMAERTGIQIQENLKACGIGQFSQLTYELIKQMKYEIFKFMEKLPLVDNQIFFECHNGKGYQCNCKYIAKALLDLKVKVKLVWSLEGQARGDMPSEIHMVEKDTYAYYEAKYCSKVGIWNSADNEYKREGQYFINTWHGSGPFKKVQASIHAGEEEFLREIEWRNNQIDVFISNTGDNTQMFRESFLYHGEIYECGSPRNDIFFRKNTIRKEVCARLGIDPSKKIVLYAPTFRGDRENSFKHYDLNIERVLHSLNKRFGQEFVFVYRFHYFLNHLKEAQQFYPEAVNATLYPDSQELLVAADVLITDYSSIMWDFSLQERPIFLYHNDAAEYEDERGFYSSPAEWPYPKAHTTEEMVDCILNFEDTSYRKKVRAFIEKYQSFDDGHATERVIERIMEVL